MKIIVIHWKILAIMRFSLKATPDFSENAMRFPDERYGLFAIGHLQKLLLHVRCGHIPVIKRKKPSSNQGKS